MKLVTFLLVGALILSTAAQEAIGQDAAHVAAAERYAAVVPMDDEIDLMLSFYVKDVPVRDRKNVATAIKSRLDRDRLMQIYLAILVDVYTTEELDALAKFYATPVGASARSKEYSVKDGGWRYRAEVERAVRNAQRGPQSGAQR